VTVDNKETRKISRKSSTRWTCQGVVVKRDDILDSACRFFSFSFSARTTWKALRVLSIMVRVISKTLSDLIGKWASLLNRMDLYKSTAIPAYQVRFHGAAKFHTLSQKDFGGKTVWRWRAVDGWLRWTWPKHFINFLF